MKGYVQLYTGNGKGKTTAALGLALRAVGAGKKVYFAQFVKGKTSYEIEALTKYLPAIRLKQYGRGCFIKNDPVPEDIAAALVGLEEVKEIIQSGAYDVVVLDGKESVVQCNAGLIEDHHIVGTTLYYLLYLFKSHKRCGNVLRLRIVFNEASPAVLFQSNGRQVLGQGLNFGVSLAFHKLGKIDLFTSPDSPQGQAQCCSGLAFAITGIKLHVSLHFFLV